MRTILNNRVTFKLIQGIFLFILQGHIYAQDTTKIDSACPQRDFSDVLRKFRHKPPKEKGSKSFLLLPIIGSNPALGFVFGVGGQYAFKLGEKDNLYSFISGQASVTTRNQFLFQLKNNIYTKNAKIFLNGDWRYLIYSQSTFGLGTSSPGGGIVELQYSLKGIYASEESFAQPMTFNFLRFFQTVSYKIKRNLYLGAGYNLDKYTQIVDEKLRLVPGDTFLTSHYVYNTNYNFNLDKYSFSALAVNLFHDTRDNVINAYKGHLLLLTWRGDFTNNRNFYNVEWRSFHSLSKKNHRHVLGFWLLGNFTPEGEFPYLILPATAYDQENRSARGYAQGRFRGSNLVYGETEYRFPISKCGGVLGGVLFLNASTADSKTESLELFQSVKPGYGFGLRVLVNKQSRTNVCFDFGFGEKSFGFYLTASETF